MSTRSNYVMSALDYYKNTYKAWNKEAGPKPTIKEVEQAHQLARPGSKDALALAMYLRPGGATSQQVSAATKGPRLNKMRNLVDAGTVRKLAISASGEGHTVYKIALAAKKASRTKKQELPVPVSA